MAWGKNRWCRRAESNRRHEDFQSSALPTELPRQERLAEATGLEPVIYAVTGRYVNQLHHASDSAMVGETGLEPVTPSL